MLLIIYNLPVNINYNEVKALIRENCGLDDIILDNLVNDKPGTRRVTVGLAEESDAAILVRKINGLYIGGHQLFVENVRQKKASEQPYRTAASYREESLSNQNCNNTTNMQANIPGLYMNPYQTPYNVNMPCYMPQVQNTLGPSQSQGVPQIQAPLYQSNIPFYQQVQQMPDQPGPSYQQKSLHITTPNAQNNNQQRSSQPLLGSNREQNKSVAQDWRNRDHNASHGSSNDRNDKRGRNDRRDDKNGRDRDTKYDHKDSRDRGAFRGRDERRDRGTNRGDEFRESYNDYNRGNKGQRRPDDSRSGRFPDDRGQRVDQSIEADLRSRIEEKTHQKFNTRFDEKSTRDHERSFTQQNPIRPSQGKSNVNFNQVPNMHTFDQNMPNRTTSNVKNQDGNLKRKMELPPESNFTNTKKVALAIASSQFPKKFIAPQFLENSNDNMTKKRQKFEALDTKKKEQRFNTWVHQVAATIGKEVMRFGSKLNKDYPPVYTEVKKCIASRIFVLFDNTLAFDISQIINEYRKVYKKNKDDYIFFQQVVNKVLDGKKIQGGQGEPSKPKNGAAPLVYSAPNAQAKSLNDSTPQKKAIHQMTSQPKQPHAVPVNKVSAPKPPAANTLPKPKVLSLNPPPHLKRLPPYPGGSKKVYNQQKNNAMAQYWGDDGHRLEGIQLVALDTELEELLLPVIEACVEVDNECGKSHKSQWENVRNTIERVLSIQVTNRILNIPNYLSVRIHFSPKKPDRAALEEFLRKHNVISLKKSKRKKMFVATCNSFNGYDRLCSLKDTVVDGVTLRFRPLHLSGPPLKGRFKRQYGGANEDDEEFDDTDKDSDGEDDNDDAEDDYDIQDEHDQSVTIIEEPHDVIELGDTDECEEKETQNEVQDNVNTVDETNNDVEMKEATVKESTSEDQNNCDNEIQATKNDLIEDNKSDPNDTKTIHINKDSASDLIVGDHSYVVLDDADDEDKNYDGNEQEIKEVINNADITEDDLEDF